VQQVAQVLTSARLLVVAHYLNRAAAVAAGQRAALAVHQLAAQAAAQTQQAQTQQQTQVAAVAVQAVTTRQAVTAAAELFMSGLRFNHERTIFCTT
jgi:uncharacterized protein YjiK